jgi:hypothetical protein
MKRLLLLSHVMQQDYQHCLMSFDPVEKLSKALVDVDVTDALNHATQAWVLSQKPALIQCFGVLGVITFAVFFAFGANQDHGLHWAVKEYLDNVADVCSVFSLYFVVLIIDCTSFISQLLEIYSRGRVVKENYLTQVKCTGLSLAFVFSVFVFIAAPVAVVAYFFGEGHTYVHYVQKYMDEVISQIPMSPSLTIHMIAGRRLCYNHSGVFVSFTINHAQRNSSANFQSSGSGNV